MNVDPLMAISPVDGRYHTKTLALSEYFSEYALIHYRCKVEVEYFIALSEEGVFDLDTAQKENLRKIYTDFDIKDPEKIKKTEQETNHDVKAVEYYIKERLRSLDMSHLQEWVHFGLTSQDINNTAMPMMLQDGMTRVLLPSLGDTISVLRKSAELWKDTPMLAHTHGQPASPTTVGKEIRVFVERLLKQYDSLLKHDYEGKFGGATGNFNAHYVALPDHNWEAFAEKFLRQNLNLTRQTTTTQIEHYDGIVALFDNLRRANVILVDLCRDVWQYISMEYFGQQVVEGEVGSSAMPHKVNPIDFENAEGNLLYANSSLSFFAHKLPISRLQRDLTDSTVTRNFGMPIAHTYIALQSIQKGWNKLLLNREKVVYDLNQQWIILAEAIQTILRRVNYEGAYEALKKLTRGNKNIDQKDLNDFVDTLDVSEETKEEIRQLSPTSYIGSAGA